ncbi:hypothetical protein MMC30_003901 [Trapelia coarctata]|nr:hypothetical protein [Trapelia coarctata]
MDPVSVFSVVAGAVGLAVQCGGIAQQLYSIVTKNKNAELTIRCLADECENIRLAWSRIEQWSRYWGDDAAADLEVLERLNKSTLTGSMIMSALENDLNSIGDLSTPASFRKRTKMVFKESDLTAHRERIGGMVAAVHLLLEVIKLPSLGKRNELLTKKSHVLRSSDETAWTIVQSRPSTVVESIRSRKSETSADITYKTEASADITYRRLSFENDLFTAPVYKRNYIGLLRSRLGPTNAKEHPQPIQNSKTQQIPQQLDEGPCTEVLSATSSRTASQQAESTHDSFSILEAYEDTEAEDDDATILPFASAEDFINAALADAALNAVPDAARLSGLSIFSSLQPDTWALDLAASQGRLDVLAKLLQPIYITATDEWRTKIYFEACSDGDEALLALLIKRGTSVHRRSPTGCEGIHVAALNDQTGAAEVLYREGACMTTKDGSGNQPIHISSSCGHVSFTTFLLSKGASVDCCNSNGDTPLRLATGRGSDEVVRILLRAGASILDRDREGKQPLHIACEAGMVGTATLLLEAGAETDGRDFLERQPLHYATERGLEKLVWALLKARASVNAHDYQRRRPLHVAVERGWLSVVNLLLDAKAVLDVVDNWGRQPIDYAIEKGSKAMILALLKAEESSTIFSNGHLAASKAMSETGTLTYLMDSYPRSIWGCFKASSPEYKLAFLKIGSSLQSPGRYFSQARQTPFLAAEAGCVELVSSFLDFGIPVHARDDSGLQLIHYATIGDFPDLVSVLIKAGASVVDYDGFGRQPIAYATHNCSYEVTDLLLNAGASIHHTDSDGLQMIHRATLAQAIDCITYLVSRGANLSAETHDFRCYKPLQLACSRGLESSVRALLFEGASCGEENNWAHSPFGLAVLGRHTNIITILIQNSLDVDVSNPEIGGPALFALVTGKPTGVEVSQLDQEDVLALAALLEHGVDVNSTDTHGSRVHCHFLRYPAVWNRESYEFLKLLLDHGYDVNAADIQGNQVLHEIAHASWGPSFVYLVRLLASSKYGARIDATDTSGKSPLYIAATNTNERMVECLFEHGASGLSPLDLQEIKSTYTKLEDPKSQSAASRILELLEMHRASEPAETASREEGNVGELHAREQTDLDHLNFEDLPLTVPNSPILASFSSVAPNSASKYLPPLPQARSYKPETLLNQ